MNLIVLAVLLNKSTQTDNLKKNNLEWGPHNKQHMVSAPTTHV